MAEDFGTISVSDSCEYLTDYRHGAPWAEQGKCGGLGFRAYVVTLDGRLPLSYTFCCFHGSALASDLMNGGYYLLGVVPARCDCDGDPHGPTIHVEPPAGSGRG